MVQRTAGAAATDSQFQGFGPQALDFFKALAFHQSKEWFSEHKAIYERDVKTPMVLLIGDLTAGFAVRGIPLMGLGERSVFRLHRDIRFSKDQSPYKTHAGAVLTRHGSKNSPGLFYIHAAPDRSFAAAGFYHAEPALLAAIRSAIAEDAAGWLGIERRLSRSGFSLSTENKVTRLPKGFDPKETAEVAEALKLKSFIIQKPLAPEDLFNSKLVADLIGFAETALPLLDFGWKAIAVERVRG
ncbi:MAG: TIGR02453 family protein [Rhodomicrobium sp.]